jgi:transposase
VPFLPALPGPVRVAFEPTGAYHRALGYRLLPEKFEVFSLSSVALARFRAARHGAWDKNDSKDAQVMLAMMKQGLVPVCYDPLQAGSQDWQELSHTCFQLTLARTRLQHSLLLHDSPLCFPEFGRYCYSTRAAWFLRFLLRFPTASAVRALRDEAFVAEAWDLVGRKVEKRKKLQESYARAAATVGRPVALDSPALEMFRLQLARYLELNQQREQLDLRAQEWLAGNADLQRLPTLPGIAAVLNQPTAQSDTSGFKYCF